jgi:hypothetical protein
LVAALDSDDQDHVACLRLMSTARGPLRIPGPVLTEVCYLVEREQGPRAEALFLTSLADGEFELVHPGRGDLRRMADLVSTYHDLPLGAVDASVVALAERMGDYDVATLDAATSPSSGRPAGSSSRCTRDRRRGTTCGAKRCRALLIPTPSEIVTDTVVAGSSLGQHRDAAL